MSTLKTTNIQHPSASVPAITLDSAGAMTGSFPYPNRNLLYNGACQVHQRGTSTASITGTNYYTADRWVTNISNLGTWTQSVENDAPSGSGLRKSLKMLCTTAKASPASGDYVAINQYLEGQDLQRIAKGTASAQQLTLSFWVKSNVTGTYIAVLFDMDNTRSISASYSVIASGTWERKVLTFSSDTAGLLDNDNAASFYVSFFLGAGSTYTSGTLQTSWGAFTAANYLPGQTNLAASTNNYWQITGVQLEASSVATPFEFKSYGQELRECQRYFETQDWTINKFRVAVVYANSQNAQLYCQYAVPKRSTPTSITWSANGSGRYVSNVGVNGGQTISANTTDANGTSVSTVATFNLGSGWLDSFGICSISAEL